MTNPERLYVTYFCVSGPQTEAYLADGPEGQGGCPVVAEYVRGDVFDASVGAAFALGEAKHKGIDVEVMRVALADLRRVRGIIANRASGLRLIGEGARASGVEDVLNILDEEVFQ